MTVGMSDQGKTFSPTEFRKELVKIMPGYNWTVHKTDNPARMVATGIQSSGFNRLSTLRVIRMDGGPHGPSYQARSAGHGTRAEWMHTNTDGTLARALRGLQDHYTHMASTYRQMAERLQDGRAAPPVSP